MLSTLEVKAFLESLSRIEDDEDFKYECNDYDLGEVLDFFADGEPRRHLLRYSDGTEEMFSFD